MPNDHSMIKHFSRKMQDTGIRVAYISPSKVLMRKLVISGHCLNRAGPLFGVTVGVHSSLTIDTIEVLCCRFQQARGLHEGENDISRLSVDPLSIIAIRSTSIKMTLNAKTDGLADASRSTEARKAATASPKIECGGTRMRDRAKVAYEGPRHL